MWVKRACRGSCCPALLLEKSAHVTIAPVLRLTVRVPRDCGWAPSLGLTGDFRLAGNSAGKKRNVILLILRISRTCAIESVAVGHTRTKSSASPCRVSRYPRFDSTLLRAVMEGVRMLCQTAITESMEVK